MGGLAAGLHGVIGILALRCRTVTAEGEYIDISMLDCLVSMLNSQATYCLHSGPLPDPQGRAHDSIPTYRASTAAEDREVVITANTEPMWAVMCKGLGREDLPEDERFGGNAVRFRNREALWAEIESAFRTQPARYRFERFNELRLPAALASNFDGVFTDLHALEQEIVLELHGEDGDRVKVPWSLIKLDRDQRRDHRFPPRLGQDAHDVFREALGIDKATFGAWDTDGLFGAWLGQGTGVCGWPSRWPTRTEKIHVQRNVSRRGYRARRLGRGRRRRRHLGAVSGGRRRLEAST